jgi:hypothetical protein
MCRIITDIEGITWGISSVSVWEYAGVAFTWADFRRLLAQLLERSSWVLGGLSF